MAIRNIQIQYRGSYLGVVWTVLSPILMLGIYTFVFGYVFGGSFDGETPLEHALGIFVGLAIHNFIAETIVYSPQLIANNAAFVKKVVFPLEVLVAARLAAALLTLGIKSILILISATLLGKSVGFHYAQLIPLLLLLTVSGFGLSMIFSSIGVFIKDLANASQFISMALLFGSAVFYPISKIPEDAWSILRFNPLVFMIDGARNLVLWGESVPATYYLVPVVSCVLFFVLGNACFQKLRFAFSDVI